MPESYVWTQEYSVGVEEMDEQHKQFIKLSNDVLAYVKTCANDTFNSDELLTVITRLGDYALYHLGSEEEYFKQFACENTDHHIFIHNQFRETLKDFLARYRSGVTDHCRLAEEIASFCVTWLLTHILTMDKQYTACFHKNGKH